MIKVAVTDLEYDKAVEVFANAAGFECLRAPTPEAGLAEFVRANAVAYVIVGVDKYRNELYEALPRGGIIARFGVGHDGIDKQLASDKGIYCTNTPGVLDDSVAECAVGLMLSAARRLAECAADNKNHRWQNHLGAELSGKTLSIIGCGNIGRKVAKIAKAGFSMKVIGFDIASPKDMSCIDEFTSDFATAVKNADFVTLHIPDIPATKNFINAERIAMMKRNAILINTARGGVLDEDALYDAIAAGTITNAALDVFKCEPYLPQTPEKDLRDLEPVIMTPHIGSSTNEACNRMAESALQNIYLITNGNAEQADLVK